MRDGLKPLFKHTSVLVCVELIVCSQSGTCSTGDDASLFIAFNILI